MVVFLDQLFNYNLNPSCHARDLLMKEYRPDPRDRETRDTDTLASLMMTTHPTIKIPWHS